MFICVLVILASALLLLSCGKGKVTYEEGFPTEDSPALLEFFKDYFSGSGDKLIIKENRVNVYVEDNEMAKTINYYQYMDEEIAEYYSSVFVSDNPAKTLYDLRKTAEQKELYKLVESTTEYSLPIITLKADNQLQIKTLETEKVFDLPGILENYEIKPEDDLIINMESLSSKNFSIGIENTAMEDYDKRFVSIFIKQDLTDLIFTRPHYEELNQAIAKGKLVGYENLIFNKDLKEKFVPAIGGYGIFDVEKNKIVQVEEPDYQSKDGKYVYLNGAEDKLLDGNQKIQTIDNYMDGNDIYEAEFKISFNKIAKKLDFKTSGVGISDIVYFNEDFVVLRLKYNGIIVGDAGATNVIIDLQGDPNNPTAYLVDLGIK